VLGQQGTDEADAADIFIPVFLGKAQPLAQVLAGDVAVQVLAIYAAFLEFGTELERQRGLPRAGKAGEPNRYSFHW
jgi:hypothetical protein